MAFLISWPAKASRASGSPHEQTWEQCRVEYPSGRLMTADNRMWSLKRTRGAREARRELWARGSRDFEDLTAHR